MHTMRVPASRSQVYAIIGFSAFYILAAAAAAMLARNSEFVFYIVVMLVLATAIFLVHRAVGLSAGLLWCLTAWGFLHMAGGLVPLPESWPANGPIRVLYSWWIIPDTLKYDQVIHSYGFGITTWLCWQALSVGVQRGCGKPPFPSLGILTLCAAAGMGFGALNEVVEFIATLSMTETNVGGYVNTGWDLVANLVGASIAAFLIRWRHHTDIDSPLLEN
jgi:hypothetical protein